MAMGDQLDESFLIASCHVMIALILSCSSQIKLEGCILTTSVIKTAKGSIAQGTPQAPGDATVLKRFPR